MPRQKNETLTLRTTQDTKLAADQEHRSLTSMIEVLVLDYAKRHKMSPKS